MAKSLFDLLENDEKEEGVDLSKALIDAAKLLHGLLVSGKIAGGQAPLTTLGLAIGILAVKQWASRPAEVADTTWEDVQQLIHGLIAVGAGKTIQALPADDLLDDNVRKTIEAYAEQVLEAIRATTHGRKLPI